MRERSAILVGIREGPGAETLEYAAIGIVFTLVAIAVSSFGW